MKSQFNYIKKLFHDQKIILISLFIFCFLFQYFFSWLIFKSAMKKVIETYLNILPSSVTSFLGIKIDSKSFGSQMLAFGYGHPLILICLSFLPVSISSRYISGEVESKTFDFILTGSFKRFLVPVDLFIFLVFSLFMQFVFLFLGTVTRKYMFDLDIYLSGYAVVAVTGLFFYISMGAISFLIASYQDEKGKAIAKIIGLLVILYFFNTIIRLNESLEFLKSYSYFQLYHPVNIVLGKVKPLSSIIISILITVVCFFSTLIRFNRRDL